MVKMATSPPVLCRVPTKSIKIFSLESVNQLNESGDHWKRTSSLLGIWFTNQRMCSGYLTSKRTGFLTGYLERSICTWLSYCSHYYYYVIPFPVLNIDIRLTFSLLGLCLVSSLCSLLSGPRPTPTWFSATGPSLSSLLVHATCVSSFSQRCHDHWSEQISSATQDFSST